MAKEILANEILGDDALDNVTGGSYTQTFENMDTFSRGTGFQFHGSSSDRRDQFRDILFRCGVKLDDHGGSKPNEFYRLDAQGKRVEELTERQAMDLAIGNYNAGRFIC